MKLRMQRVHLSVIPFMTLGSIGVEVSYTSGPSGASVMIVKLRMWYSSLNIPFLTLGSV